MATSSTRSARSTPARSKGKGKSNVTPWLWMAFALLVVMIDQFFKILISRSFQYGESRPVTSFFNLVLVWNKGAAFSFLADAGGWQRWFFTVLGVAVGSVRLLSVGAWRPAIGDGDGGGGGGVSTLHTHGVEGRDAHVAEDWL